jgi:hypothetical protein
MSRAERAIELLEFGFTPRARLDDVARASLP